MFRGDRLIQLLMERGLTQPVLAKEVGVSQTAIWKLTRPGAQGSKHTHRIAEVLGTSAQYLMGETDDPAPLAAQSEPGVSSKAPVKAKDEDNVEINELDLAYGMGLTFLDDLPVKARSRTFSRAWLRNFTDSPVEKLFFAHGMGDSMSPTIMDQDILLIDTAQQSPRLIDKIWAIAINGMGGIKRLRPTKDGGMRVMSDNQGVPDEIAYDDELFVVGRVVAIVRKV